MNIYQQLLSSHLLSRWLQEAEDYEKNKTIDSLFVQEKNKRQTKLRSGEGSSAMLRFSEWQKKRQPRLNEFEQITVWNIFF